MLWKNGSNQAKDTASLLSSMLRSDTQPRTHSVTHPSHGHQPGEVVGGQGGLGVGQAGVGWWGQEARQQVLKEVLYGNLTYHQ